MAAMQRYIQEKADILQRIQDPPLALLAMPGRKGPKTRPFSSKGGRAIVEGEGKGKITRTTRRGRDISSGIGGIGSEPGIPRTTPERTRIQPI